MKKGTEELNLQRAQGRRLAIARAAAGYKNSHQAAEAMGIIYQTYFAHEAGTRSYAKVAQTYAKKFKTTIDWLLNEHGAPPKNAKIDEVFESNRDIAGVPLLGKVQAGLWLDISLLENEADFPMLPVARDDRFPHARQYALEVAGDSMNKLYPEGTYCTLVDFADSGLKLRVGLVVHVERHQGGSQLVENTLKAVDIVDGKIALVPRSTNPLHQPYMLTGSPDETEIVVKGVVLWANIKQQL